MKLGDRVTLQGDIYPVTLQLKVVGIFDDPDAQKTMFFNIDYLRDALPVARRSFDSTIAVLADSPDSVPRIAKAVDEMFANAPAPTKTESEQAFALSFVSFLGNIKLFLMAICAAVTFTILLVSGNTMAMSVREIIGEAISLSVIAAVIGLLLAQLLTRGIGAAGSTFAPQLRGLSMTPITAALALGLAVLLALVSSFFPAYRAARTNILDSLRYSG